MTSCGFDVSFILVYVGVCVSRAALKCNVNPECYLLCCVFMKYCKRT